MRVRPDVDALVELLGDLHGLLAREAQAVGRGLLELGGREGRLGPQGLLGLARPRRRRRAFPWIASTMASAAASPLSSGLSPLKRTSSPEKAPRPLRKSRLDAPVLLGEEGLDLLLAVADEPERHGLDAARREAVLDLLPEQGREVIADQAVEDAARLLGVDLGVVDLARRLDGVAYRLGRDLVEHDALDGQLGLLAADARSGCERR